MQVRFFTAKKNQVLFESDSDGVPLKFSYRYLEYDYGALFGHSEEERQYNAHLYLLVSYLPANFKDQRPTCTFADHLRLPTNPQIPRQDTALSGNIFRC